MILEFVIRHWDQGMAPQHEYWNSILFAKVPAADRARVHSTTASANDAAFLAQWDTMTFDDAPIAARSTVSTGLWNFDSPSKAPERTTQSRFRSPSEDVILARSPSPTPSSTPLSFLSYVSRSDAPAREMGQPPQRDVGSASARNEQVLSLPAGHPIGSVPGTGASSTASSRSQLSALITAPLAVDNDIADDENVVEIPRRVTRNQHPTAEPNAAAGARGRGGRPKAGGRGNKTGRGAKK